MNKKIRQSVLTTFILTLLITTTTVSAIAASWHASIDHYWTIQRACPDGVQVVARWYDYNNFPPPLTYNWEAHIYYGQATDEPTIVNPDPVELIQELGSIEVTIDRRPTSLRYREGWRWKKTFIWGKGRITWNVPGFDVGDRVFVRHPGAPEGFVMKIQDCGK
ncbi:MAG: hypothetical protein AAF702_37245 [Chloroflexota bacterium]